MIKDFVISIVLKEKFHEYAASNTTIHPSPVRDSDQMNCSTVCTSPLNESLFANFTWFRNGSAVHDYDTQVSGTNASTFYTDKLVNETLVAGDNWTCAAESADSQAT